MGFIERLKRQGKLPPLPREGVDRAVFPVEDGHSAITQDWALRRSEDGLRRRTVWLSAETNARLERYRDRHGLILSTAVEQLLVLALGEVDESQLLGGQ